MIYPAECCCYWYYYWIHVVIVIDVDIDLVGGYFQSYQKTRIDLIPLNPSSTLIEFIAVEAILFCLHREKPEHT